MLLTALAIFCLAYMASGLLFAEAVYRNSPTLQHSSNRLTAMLAYLLLIYGWPAYTPGLITAWRSRHN